MGVDLPEAHLDDLDGSRVAAAYPALADHEPVHRVSVCLLTLNEEEHIGRSLDRLVDLEIPGVVVDLHVADGGSTDATRAIVTERGVDLITLEDVLPGFGPVNGKGDSLWRAASVLPGDAMVFLDADIDGDLANAARSLATPVMADASCHFVKGYFVRERLPGVDPELAGGRVTELVARPLIASVAPWLGFVHEPLSGQVAMSRRFAQQMRVVTGYGLEIGMLFDAVLTLGTDGVAEVDIGTIRNPPKPGDHLTRMGDEVASTLLRRVAAFHRDPGFADTVSHLVVAKLPERPPLHTVTA